LKALPFPYIASFIRLGLKYDFQDLFDIASERLAFENSTTLLEHDASMEALAGAAGKAVPHSTTQIEHYPGVYHDMLTLARENDLWVLLPCAYYRVAAKFSLVSPMFRFGPVPQIHTSRIKCRLAYSRGLQDQTKPSASCRPWTNTCVRWAANDSSRRSGKQAIHSAGSRHGNLPMAARMSAHVWGGGKR
jgi:hypothetical protein